MMARMDAAQNGHRRYQSTVPCKHGHVGERYTSTGGCIPCLRRWTVGRPKPAQQKVEFCTFAALEYAPADIAALKCYLIECVIKHHESKGLRAPLDAMRLYRMRTTGIPYDEQ